MADINIKAKINRKGMKAFTVSGDVEDWMHQLGVAVLARAIPKTGIDSGLLRSSMDYKTDEEGVEFGSNVSKPGQAAVEYAYFHWNKHTQPWTSTFDDLGIDYTATAREKI